MTCRQVREQMCEFLDGCLDEGLSSRFSSHLEDCVACRKEVAELRHALFFIKQAMPVEPPCGLREAVLAKIKGDHAACRRRVPAGFSQAVAAAVVFLLVVSGNLFLALPRYRNQAVLPGTFQGSQTGESLAEEGAGSQSSTVDQAKGMDQGPSRVPGGERTNLEAAPATDEDTRFILASRQDPAVERIRVVRFVLNLVLLPLFPVLLLIAVIKRREAGQCLEDKPNS